MSKTNHHITVFEHQVLRFDKGEKRITKEQFIALEKYHGEGVPYYSLCYNGVHFNEYVGVIQIGTTVIEVLPKADRYDTDESKWRDILIGMLKAVGSFDIKATSDSSLKIQRNNILDLYFEVFIKEVEYLLHTGLVKQYRKKEGNVTALKGSLQFGKHIQQNLTHQERFYVGYTTYDTCHKLHFILYKTIKLLKQLNINAGLNSRIGALLLHFPEMPDMKVTPATFDKFVFNRKTQSYKKSIEIAKLLLLKYHPDLSKGGNHVLALMFDMNKLWEQFIYMSLRRHRVSTDTITTQTSKYFWKPTIGYRSFIRPDILLKKDKGHCVVLDTKWKNLNGRNPSPEDLRQMFVYHEYYGATRVALIYPGSGNVKTEGWFIEKGTDKIGAVECSVIQLSVEKDIKEWQKSIYNQLFAFV